MRPLTRKKIKADEFKNKTDVKKERLVKTPEKKVAQCCAKSSTIVSGCHD